MKDEEFYVFTLAWETYLQYKTYKEYKGRHTFNEEHKTDENEKQLLQRLKQLVNKLEMVGSKNPTTKKLSAFVHDAQDDFISAGNDLVAYAQVIKSSKFSSKTIKDSIEEEAQSLLDKYERIDEQIKLAKEKATDALKLRIIPGSRIVTGKVATTVCCIVQDRDDEGTKYLLTTAIPQHIKKNTPAYLGGDKIGMLSKNIILYPHKNNQVNAALIKLEESIEWVQKFKDILPSSDDLSLYVKILGDRNEAIVGEYVKTWQSFNNVQLLSKDYNEVYFEFGEIIEFSLDYPMTAGSAGTPIINQNDNRLAAMHFAGCATKSFAFPINRVFNELNIELAEPDKSAMKSDIEPSPDTLNKISNTIKMNNNLANFDIEVLTLTYDRYQKNLDVLVKTNKPVRDVDEEELKGKVKVCVEIELKNSSSKKLSDLADKVSTPKLTIIDNEDSKHSDGNISEDKKDINKAY